MDKNFEKIKQEKGEAYTKAIKKRDTLGSYSLTREDRIAMGAGEENSDLIIFSGENKDKALYEVLTLEEIEKQLDEAIQYKDHPSDMGKIIKDALRKDIEFLKSVGKIPEKYKDFDVNNL